MAKIDILLPFWGDVELFKLTVKSVLRQTEKDWRLVILDDHYPSTEPKEYIGSLSDPRIIYIRHKKNIGITKNFNAALAEAKTEHFVMLGCDDIMLENYVERAISKIGDATFYQPKVEVIDESGSIFMPLSDRVKSTLRFRKEGIYKGEKLAASLSHGNWLYFPSITWKTHAVRKYGFDNTYKIAEDLALELKLITDDHTLYLDNEITFQYRRFAKSLSSVEKKKGGIRFSEEQAVYTYLAEIFGKKGWKKAQRAAKMRITSRIHELMNR
jgi:glycosyltransferase involved in cell wall biosynthesis